MPWTGEGGLEPGRILKHDQQDLQDWTWEKERSRTNQDIGQSNWREPPRPDEKKIPEQVGWRGGPRALTLPCLFPHPGLLPKHGRTAWCLWFRS